MARKKKKLPKDFDELIKAGNIEALKKVYDQCELNAYFGYSEATALSMRNVPDELVRWLIEQGVDINERHKYKETALHHQARCGGNVKLLLELGADITVTDYMGDTPLHVAANAFNPQSVCELIEVGASVSVVNDMEYTPLESALSQCRNIDIVDMAEVAGILLDAGTQITPNTFDLVKKIGEQFEFYRDSFNKDYLQETDEALNRLYRLFDVAPVKKQNRHDGVSKIVVSSTRWQDQHNELWNYLVPGSGHALTVQGEVVRITGRVSYEVIDNGGVNWDNNYRKMLKALVQYLGSGTPLNDEELQEVTTAVKVLNNGSGDDEPTRLCELAVKWVLANPEPVVLGEIDYKR